jgi:hypothetical protein
MAATTRSGSAVRRGDAEIAVKPIKPPEAPAEPASDAMQTMAQMIYSGSYALAYGIVYATVFVAQLLPQDNPVMQGFHDGGKAAMDELSHG